MKAYTVVFTKNLCPFFETLQKPSIQTYHIPSQTVSFLFYLHVVNFPGKYYTCVTNSTTSFS